MLFINSLKIFIHKIGLLWGLFVYFLIVGLIFAGLGLSFFVFFYKDLKSSGIIDNIQSIFIDVAKNGDFVAFYEHWGYLLKNVSVYLETSPSAFFESVLFLIVIGGIVGRMVFGMHAIPLVDCVMQYTNANANFGFFNKFISNIKTSFKYVTYRLLFSLLFDLVITSIIVAMFYLIRVSHIENTAGFFVVLFLILLFGLRCTVSACWSQVILDCKKGIKKSFRHNLSLVSNNFFRIYGLYLIVVLFLFAINFFIATFSFGVGLVFSLPASILFLTIINTLLYYHINDKRYYINGEIFDAVSVLKTKKLLKEKKKASKVNISNASQASQEQSTIGLLQSADDVNSIDTVDNSDTVVDNELKDNQ